MFTKVQNTFVASVLAFLIGTLFLVLGGCEEPPPPPPAATKVEKTEPPATEEEEGVAEENEEEGQGEEEESPGFTYDPSNRREPFKSLVAEELPPLEDIIVMPSPGEVPETPLQKFEISELKIKGILLGGLGEFARVEAPDGKSYTIELDTLVGLHGGKVISITDNAVIVKETIHYKRGDVEEVEEVETPIYLNPIEAEEE